MQTTTGHSFALLLSRLSFVPAKGNSLGTSVYINSVRGALLWEKNAFVPPNAGAERTQGRGKCKMVVMGLSVTSRMCCALVQRTAGKRDKW